MKKIFSSLFSVALAFSCLFGNGVFRLYAEAADITTGTVDYEETVFVFDDSIEAGATLPRIPEIKSNNSENAYNYADYIDANNLAVYETLSTWVTPSLDRVTVDLPEAISFTVTGLPGTAAYTEADAAKLTAAMLDACKAGMDALLFDKPEIFWLDLERLSVISERMGYTYSASKRQYTIKLYSLDFVPAVDPALSSLEGAIKYKEKLDSAIENFETEGETRYEKLKDIHDTIALFTYYDENAKYRSSAIGSLVEPGVVCEGYSKGFKLICDKLDIPCVLVFGNYEPQENVAHMWNYVKMENGKWYAVDVTWDDVDNYIGVKHTYFMKGSKNFFSNHTEESDYIGTILVYPELSTSDFDPSEVIIPETTTTTTTTKKPTTTTTTTTKKPATTTTTTTKKPTTTTTTTTKKPTTTTTTTTKKPATTTTTTTKKPTTTTTTTTKKPTTTTTTTTKKPTTTTTTTTKKPTTTTTTTTKKPTTTTTTTTKKPTTTTTTTTKKPVTTEPTTSAPEFEKGDFNRDGKVNAADLVCCVKAVLGDSEYNCDFNEDEIVDVFDVILFRKYLVETE